MSDKTSDLDEDIRALKKLLEDKGLKFKERMQVYGQLKNLYNLRLRYSGTGRGGSFNRPKGSQT